MKAVDKKNKQNVAARRLAVAKKVARLFFKIGNVVVITVSGSLARGFSDEHSDIEMYVYYENKMPRVEDVSRILKKLNSPLTRSKKIFWFHKAWGYHTFFRADGIKIELGYRNTQDIENRMNSFLGEFSLPQPGIYDTPFGHYESGVADCILESMVLYKKSNWLEKVRHRLRTYPMALKRTTIKYYYRDAKTMTGVKIKQAVGRNDTFHFNACLARVLRSLNLCLFALNEKYYPGDKWNDKYISKFSIIPKDYISDIESILGRGCIALEDKKFIYKMLNKVINNLNSLIRQHI